MSQSSHFSNSQYVKSGYFEAYKEQRDQEKKKTIAAVGCGVIAIILLTLYITGGGAGAGAGKPPPAVVARACREECAAANLRCDIICKDFMSEPGDVFEACKGGCQRAGLEDCRRACSLGSVDACVSAAEKDVEASCQGMRDSPTKMNRCKLGVEHVVIPACNQGMRIINTLMESS
eukprot:g2016.t1